MKQLLKYYLSSCLVSVASSLILLSCSDNDTSSELYGAIYPESVSINLTDELSQLVYTDNTQASVLPLLKGEVVSLSYSILPENITFSEVSWTSSNTSVATVTGEGTITAISGDGTGYSIVQVAPTVFYSGSNIYGTLKILVSNALTTAESISVSAPANEVFVGETLQMSFSIFPENSTYKTVEWRSSDESVATVNAKGLVSGVSANGSTTVTISAYALDGSQVYGSADIVVNEVIQPQEVVIGQEYAVSNNYYCAINEKYLNLNVSITPANSTLSLVKWESSDESIATVSGGVVMFNQSGVFGDVTITATCPDTGSNSSIRLNIAEGLLRELFHDESNYTWYNATQSDNGTSSSHVWSYGKVTVTTYKQNDTKQRGDFRCWSSKTWLHAGNYPIFAIRIDDLLKTHSGVTARNITFDASGTCNSTTYSGGLDGNNNKWKYKYECSDGSSVLVYNLSAQSWATGGILPTTATATFTTLQFKYADIATLTEQVTYNVYWVQSFKTLDEVKNYITSEGLTFE